MEIAGWSSFLGGGGGSGKYIAGQPWWWGWGSWNTSFHTSLTGIASCMDTCGSTWILVMLGWDCNVDITSGRGLKDPWPSRLRSPICSNWLNSS